MYDIKQTYNARSLCEALELFEQKPGARVVAGGTDIMVALRHHKLSEAVLINIREIPELNGISLLENGDIFIGACTSFDEIYRNQIANKYIPMLCEACNQVGSPQIRHIGTIGGNLCNGAVSADSAPSVLVYDSVILTESPGGQRHIPASEFHIGPGRTILRTNEIVVGILISRDNYESYGGSYLKFGQRNSMEISTLGVSTVVKLSEDKKSIKNMKMAFGVAAATPVRVNRLEEQVRGMAIGKELYELVQTRVLDELNPRDSWRASKAFREQLIKVQSVRSLKNAISRAGGKADV